ncbi:MAG: DUF5916 domain-containing protein [Vicinamibacterales bacterium]
MPALAAAQASPPSAPGTSRQVMAVKSVDPIVLDGRLDERSWQHVQPATDFIQQEPAEGMPATSRTEVRFVYDETTLYVGATLFSKTPNQLVTDELKRDFDERGGDLFGIVLDTFLDQRNSYGFLTNPGGAQREVQAFDNGQKNDASWDGIWFVHTSVTPEGWTVEAAIPFKTLRFPDRPRQQWGLNVVRVVRRENEVTLWSAVPRPQTQYHVGYAGRLSGIAGVRPGHNLRVTPFATATALHQRAAPSQNSGNGGFDAKWAITPSFVLDGTVRTDFAQVEADDQQINLTRFSLLFPEKRQFFLEAPNSFQIGLTTQDTGVVATSLLPFSTRRIGLSETGTPIPVVGGVRLSGQSGGMSVGALNMQTGQEGERSGDNFTAVRVAQQLGGGVTAGAFYFGREAAGGGRPLVGAFNRVAGADLLFRPTRIFDLEALWMQGASDGPDDDSARRLRARLRGNRRRATFDYLHVGDHFRHDLGFVRRRGTAMIYGDYSEVFRPAATKRWAREHTLRAEVQTHLNTNYTSVLTNQDRLVYGIGFPHGGEFRVTGEHNFERALEGYKLRGVFIPAGSYQFNELVLNYSSDRSAHLSGQLQTNYGDFWGGTRRRIKSAMRLRLNTHLAATAAYEREQIALPNGEFVADLGSLRLDWSPTTRMFVNTLIQYVGGGDGWLSNVRFNFIHHPLSNIYVVWNEGRASSASRRSLSLKYTHSFGF